MNPRTTATKVLQQILVDQHSLTEVLPLFLARHSAIKERPLIQELCYGFLRHYESLNYLASHLLQKPLKEKDMDVHIMILIGLYQLIHLNIAQHAAVMETVNATKELRKPWAKDLVNAVLRNYLRQQVVLTEKLAKADAQYNQPIWLLTKLQQDWPEHWQSIALANNQHPPMTLRINQQKINREEYLQKLNVQHISAQPCIFAAEGITLDKPLDVNRLPGFSEGEVSVQDGAAQLTVKLLELAPGLRLLDACAAPGGKLCHILESEPKIQAVALDVARERVNKIQENLQRLQLSAVVKCVDATQPPNWWDGISFDRILVDAPCSSTGVMRRHPDIKLRRQPRDIAQFAAQQLALLRQCWLLLKPSGILLYATCSVLRQENEQVITQFLREQPDAREKNIAADWGIKTKQGRQILPGDFQMDGFYYAKLIKSPGCG